jgi:site-specific recombinase XerD
MARVLPHSDRGDITRLVIAMNELDASDALELYLDDKRKTAAESTIRSHSDRLNWFVNWFDQTDYESLHELDGLDIRRWRVWRFDDDHADAYIKAVQDSVRVFLRFCRDIEAVDSQLPEKVSSPEGGQQRSAEIPAERAIKILEHLDKYQYASLNHTLFHLLWYGMFRVGGAHSVDIRDLLWDDDGEDQLRLRHRPKTETTLKNQYDSERKVAIRLGTRQIIDDYMAQNRVEVTDDHGRKPLFTTENGRASRNTLRNRIYWLTRPCMLRECPHDEDPDTCGAARRKNWACQCKSTESTHAIRRGSISWHLREETGKQVVSDRADVQTETLDAHYNTLSESEKAEVRRSELPGELGE